jgi:hypothetical protein
VCVATTQGDAIKAMQSNKDHAVYSDLFSSTPKPLQGYAHVCFSLSTSSLVQAPSCSFKQMVRRKQCKLLLNSALIARGALLLGFVLYILY